MINNIHQNNFIFWVKNYQKLQLLLHKLSSLLFLRSKLKKTLPLIFLVLTLNACEPGCVESDEFDTAKTFVDSKPTADGIQSGAYSDTVSSSVANWHSTPFRSDGGPILLQINGSWTPWEEASNQIDLEKLPACKMCGKKEGINNCICDQEESPVALSDQFSCSDEDSQNDGSKCSCTTYAGKLSDSDTYFISTNYQNKDETLKNADDQVACRYTSGHGLYIALFGANGHTMPNNIYHISPTDRVCDITLIGGKCLDSDGMDQYKYIYTSGGPLVKNNETNEYHKKGEFFKLIIDDNWHDDNYGGYNVNFVGGFLRDNDNGLLEYIVGSVEDLVLGNLVDGKRQNGAMEFLYNAIVHDTIFIRLVQLCLVIYVVLFGYGVLNGSLELSKKDLVVRLIKVGLVIFFTTETSWHFYNQFVVGLFKDCMDYIISIFMQSADSTMDQSTLTKIVNTQLNDVNGASYATRFSYIDFVIKKLLSEPTSKKIWSLFLGEWFGILYIPVIYALIFAFVYIMLTAAFVYITALLRLVFVLCLGPIFMVTVLFNKTDEVFKRWLAFMAAQAMQMICLFLIIYLFLVLIDRSFNELLSFKACTETWYIAGIQYSGIMKSITNRTLPEWLGMFFKIATLLFLLKMVMEKIPGFAGQLVSVKLLSGNAMKADNEGSYISSTNRSAFAIAGNVMGMAAGAAKSAITQVAPRALSGGLSAARFVGRTTGISSTLHGAAQAIPFRGITSRYRDHKIDNVIRDQQKAGKAQGLTGKDLDSFVRSNTLAAINKQSIESPNSSNIFGINNQEFVMKRLEAKLVKEPLKQFIKDATKEIKSKSGANVPLDRNEMKEAVQAKVIDWAAKNSSVSSDNFVKMLDSSRTIKATLKVEGALTSSEATRAFAGNSEAKERYMQHLQEQQFNKEEKSRTAWEKGRFAGSFNTFKNAYRMAGQKNAYNPEFARQNFLSKTQFQEEYKAKSDGQTNLNPTAAQSVGHYFSSSRLQKVGQQSLPNRIYNRKTLGENAQAGQKLFLEKYLLGGYQKDLARIDNKYQKDFIYLEENYKTKADQIDQKYKQDQNLPKEFREKLDKNRQKELNDLQIKKEKELQKLGTDRSESKLKAKNFQEKARKLLKENNKKDQENLAKIVEREKNNQSKQNKARDLLQSLSNTKNSKNKAEKELKQLKENDAKKDEILNKLLSPTGNQTEKDLIRAEVISKVGEIISNLDERINVLESIKKSTTNSKSEEKIVKLALKQRLELERLKDEKNLFNQVIKNVEEEKKKEQEKQENEKRMAAANKIQSMFRKKQQEKQQKTKEKAEEATLKVEEDD